MAVYTSTGDNEFVLLSLGSRTGGDNQRTNRVALKCENIAISTNKDVMAMPIPFSGLGTGSATKVALDFGVSTKTVSLSGIITEQSVFKKFSSEEEDAQSSSSVPLLTSGNKYEINVLMTAEEISQMIHSYVDSSFIQERQNLNELIVIIKSRVDKNYQYYNGTVDDPTPIDSADMKTIPFTWQVRDGGESLFDGKDAITPITSWPNTIDTSSSEITGISGFIRSFSTTFIPGQPFVEFSMEFEQAMGSMLG